MKKTIVFITHDLDEALKIGDRIALMKDGAIVQIGTPEEILTNPETEYVEKFVEDAAVSKVLTAEHVMKRPETVSIDKGPRVALNIMKDRGMSSLYVIDAKKKLYGLITADGAKEAKEHENPIGDYVITDIPIISPDTKLDDIFELVADSSYPIAVTSEDKKLLGVVVKGAVLGGLAGKIKILNHDEDEERGDTN